MSERHYTIKATKVKVPASALGGFYNSHGQAYQVEEEGDLSRHPELMLTMANAMRNLASCNTIPHTSLTLKFTYEKIL